MLDKGDVLDRVTDEAVISIMEENGSPLYKETYDRQSGQKLFWFRTICHGGDSHKLCYFTKSKDFFCYTNCGKMDFWGCIAKIRNATDSEFYTKVIKYVANKIGISNSGRKIGLGEDNGAVIDKELREMSEESEYNDMLEAESTLYVPTVYDESVLNYFEKDVFYKGWIKEGIRIPTMEKFHISWYENKKYIIIPHYNIDGQLIGIRRRSLNPEDAKNKYMPLFLEGKDYAHSLGLNLYGLYENKEAIERKEKAVIVEGEKSVLLSDTFFGKESHTVATCGFNISSYQLRELVSLGVGTVYLGFDKDYDIRKKSEYMKNPEERQGFENYLEKINRLAYFVSSYCPIVYIIQDTEGDLDIKDSPFDKGKKIYNKLLANAQLYESKDTLPRRMF